MKNKSIASVSLRKLLLSALVAAPLATLPSPLWALPATQTALNNVIVSKSDGVTATSTSATRVDISSTANNSVVVWTEFGSGANLIGSADTINFALPSASSSILNRVSSSGAAFASTINGSLLSNGNIVILNPNGVTIGANGIVSANSLTINTQAVTDYTTDAYFLSNGALNFAPTATEAGAAKITAGAVITAASNSGNVWVTAKNVEVAGTINGNLAVNTVNDGNVVLGSGGNLTVGHPLAPAASLSVTTTGTGTIAVGDAGVNSSVIVNGPSATLKTANGAITAAGTGVFMIGAGADSTLNADAGTGANTLRVANSTGGTIAVTAKGAAVNVSAPSGKLAVGGTMTGGLTASTGAGDLTVNGSAVTGSASITAVGGNILVGTGDLNATTGISLTADAGKNVAVRGKTTGGAFAFAGAGGALGNVSITGTDAVALPAITAANLTVTSVKALTQTGTQNVSGNVSLTSSDAATLSQTITAGNLSVTAAKAVAVNVAQTVTGGNVSVASTGDAVTLAGTITAENLTVSAAKAVTVSAAQTLSGNASVTSTGDAVSLAAAGSITADNLTVSAAKDLSVAGAQTITGGNVALTTTGGNVAISANVTAATLVANASGKIDIAGVTSTPTVSLTAGSTIGFGGLTTTTLNATAAGNISQTAATAIVATTATVQGANIALTNTGNDFDTIIVKGAVNGASITDTDGVIVGNGTAAAGNLTITGSAGAAGDIVLGAAAADTISVAGVLKLDNDASTGAITDASNNVTVLGNVSLLTGTGVIVLNGATGNGVGLNSQYGQIQIVTAGADATVFESTTLNLGAVNLGAGDLTAYSATSIINTGRLQVTDILVGAGTAAAPGDVLLNYTHADTPSTISGTVSVMDDDAALIGNYLAKSLTISAGSVGAGNLVNIPVNRFGAGLTGPVSITTTGTANLIAGAIVTTGPVSLTSGTGSITATNAANAFSTVTVTSANTTGASNVSSTLGLTVNGNVSGSQAITYTSGSTLAIGNYKSTSTGLTTFDAANDKALTDTVAGIAISGDVAFDAGSIVIDDAGHNFGGVSITTAGNGNATIVEGGTLRLASVSVNGTGRLTATSQNGSVIQTAATNIAAGSAVINAPAGGVTLNLANAVTGSVAISALGNVAFTAAADRNVSLANITAGGTLTVATSGTGTITQASSSAINAFGASSFTTANQVITLDKTGNKFGGLTINSGTAAATIKEQTTVNLRSVTSGALTVTSEGGSIIDSGTGTVTPGGAATFTAENGSIALSLAGSNYGTVALSTGGNASIIDNGGDLTLAASTVGGTLTVTNSTGNIGQSGALVVTGDTTFNASAAASTLTLTNDANKFGALRFLVGTGGAEINEVSTMNLKAGSISTGQVVLYTGGDFGTSGDGASSFLYNGAGSFGLKITAVGAIVPGSGSLLVIKGLTVFSNSAKDLSGLSLSGNLANVAPTNQGAGDYTAPKP